MFVLNELSLDEKRKLRMQRILDACVVEGRTFDYLAELTKKSLGTMVIDTTALINSGLMTATKERIGKSSRKSNVLRTKKPHTISDSDYIKIKGMTAVHHAEIKVKYNNGNYKKSHPRSIRTGLKDEVIERSTTVGSKRTICMEDTKYAKKLADTRELDRRNRKIANNYVSGSTLSTSAW